MNNMKEANAKLMLITSMIIFGTIGIFRKYLPLPSGMLAMSRGFIGMFFLLSVSILCKKKIWIINIKQNLPKLFISGAFIGFNWILLFEAYRYTSVSVATLCYYMAPVFVIIASPFTLNEKISKTKLICIVAALIGMILISGVLNENNINRDDVIGILLGLGAAALYATVIILNKKITHIKASDKTIVQLGIAGVVILPYSIIMESFSFNDFSIISIIILLIVGIVHTGIAYSLYFGAIGKIKAQTAALCSYIDPIVALILSALILNETLEISGYIGTFLVLGSAIISDIKE